MYYNTQTNTWEYTGHNSSWVNLAAGGGYIYSTDGGGGIIERYDGINAPISLGQVTIGGDASPYDLTVDCSGNFYLFYEPFSQTFTDLRKYNPSGVLLQSWRLHNPQNINGFRNAGMAMLGNKVYVSSGDGLDTISHIIAYTIGTDTITLNSSTSLGGLYIDDDMASGAGMTLSLPTLQIIASAGNTCGGTPVTFTSTATEGGSAPAYQWLKNGQRIAGATGSTYSYLPAIGDTITCEMMSSSYCASEVTVISNPVVMQGAAPVVSITASDTGIICAGTSVLFTATPTYGGTVPAYQWLKNGNPVSGATTPTYSNNTLVNGDVVSVRMTSNDPCTIGRNTAISNTITVNIGIPLPSVSITATPSASLCAGRMVTFTAATTYGGTSPAYQWLKNGIPVAGSPNGPAFTTSNLQNNDAVSVALTSGITCAVPRQVVSAPLVMTVKQPVTPGINVNIFPGTVTCAGNTVLFVTNIAGGGGNPQYQWYKNSTVIAGATNANLTTAALATGDTISVLLTSSETCVTNATVRSNKVGMTVEQEVIPSVSITANPGLSIRNGQTVLFTANSSGGGQSPYFQWIKNGADIPFANGNTYTANNLQDGDWITVRLVSSSLCATPVSITSLPAIVRVATGIAGTGLWDGDVSIFPNPNSGHFTIKVSGSYHLTGKKVVVDLLNVLGQTVYHSSVVPDQPNWSMNIWLDETLANGIYQLKVGADDGQVIKPVLVSR